MDAIIESIDVTKSYYAGNVEIPALRGVSLRIARGEFVAVCGPSGCGKSTLLHLLGGLSTPTSGRVLVEGEEVGGASDGRRAQIRRRKIGFVFQRFNLIPSLTARQNVEMALRIRRISQSDGAMDCLRSVAMADKSSRKPGQLSMGEQQRIAIARAVVSEPPIILADEPTGNLDSANSKAVLEIFRRLNREKGQTVVMITHNEEAASRADRIIRMCDGLVLGGGP